MSRTELEKTLAPFLLGTFERWNQWWIAPTTAKNPRKAIQVARDAGFTSASTCGGNVGGLWILASEMA